MSINDNEKRYCFRFDKYIKGKQPEDTSVMASSSNIKNYFAVSTSSENTTGKRNCLLLLYVGLNGLYI